MVKFIPIDLAQHRDTIIQFRKDSFVVSFGNTSGLGGDEDYLQWLEEKMFKYPAGFILIEEDGKPIGQLELTIREYEGRSIGYIHLYYLLPESRGKGKGHILHNYARQFLKDNQVNEYHLRVSPTNRAALKFYPALTGIKTPTSRIKEIEKCRWEINCP